LEKIFFDAGVTVCIKKDKEKRRQYIRFTFDDGISTPLVLVHHRYCSARNDGEGWTKV